MITRSISIELNHTIESAPKYKEDHTLIMAEKAIIVHNGTKAGKATVDIQFTDKEGKKYVMMATGAIISTLGDAIKGVESKEQ